MDKPDMNYDQAMARISTLEKQLGDMRNAAEMLFSCLGAVGIHMGRCWDNEHPDKWVDNYLEAERRCGPPSPGAEGAQ